MLKGVQGGGDLMHKIFLPIMVIGLLIAACGEFNNLVPTLTTVPSPTSFPTHMGPTLIKEIELETQTDTAYGLDWSPDGETLAVASGFEITLLGNNLDQKHTVLELEGGAIAVTWNPEKTQFATVNGYRNPTVSLWDWDSTKHQLARAGEIQAGSDQYFVSWSPDGKLLATLGDDQKSIFQIWSMDTWEELHKFDLPYTTPRRAMNWSTDSAVLYGAGESNGQVVVFALNVANGSVQEVAKLPVSQVEVFAISPDEEKLAVADPRGVAQILDITSAEIVTGFKTVDQPVSLAWNPNGTLAILDYKTKLQLWSIFP
jgi:WD40 repeat protein